MIEMSWQLSSNRTYKALIEIGYKKLLVKKSQIGHYKGDVSKNRCKKQNSNR